MTLDENVLLSSLTTFKTGGPARYLVALDTPDELQRALIFAKEKKLPLIPLGSGSNILAADSGAEAIFIQLRSQKIAFTRKGDSVLTHADAGALWDELVASTVVEGAWGLENLSGIPGTVGAAVVQNIGAYGAALSDTLEEVEAYDMLEGTARTFSASACAFGYRTSIFKKERDRYFITRVSFALSATPQLNLSYRDLKNRFIENTSPELISIRTAVIGIRKGKFPPLNAFGTAGSFFLNPVISESDKEKLLMKYPSMPLFTLPEGGVKVPIAWIFDHILALKGMREGKAFVWDKQPLVIAAEAGATSADVKKLAERIAEKTFSETGIAIIPEVRLF